MLFSNSYAQECAGNAVAERFKTRKFDVAIFPETSLDIIPGNRYTPTKEEIIKAEIYLSSQLREINKVKVYQQQTPIIHERLKKYRRQYFGYFNELGDKVLLINSIWHKKQVDCFLETRIMVLDGGSYYWEIRFNVTKGKLFDLHINGV